MCSGKRVHVNIYETDKCDADRNTTSANQWATRNVEWQQTRAETIRVRLHDWTQTISEDNDARDDQSKGLMAHSTPYNDSFYRLVSKHWRKPFGRRDQTSPCHNNTHKATAAKHSIRVTKPNLVDFLGGKKLCNYEKLHSTITVTLSDTFVWGKCLKSQLQTLAWSGWVSEQKFNVPLDTL